MYRRSSGGPWTYMKSPSHTCDHGPCPRSWQSPASMTHSMSRLVISSSGCACWRCWTNRPARCMTPGKMASARAHRQERVPRTYAMLKPVVRGARPDIVRRPQLLDVPQPLKLLPARPVSPRRPLSNAYTHVSINLHAKSGSGTAYTRQPRPKDQHKGAL